MGEIRELPKTADEFKDRYLKNNTTDHEGDAFRELRHLPCMFCGAPDLILLHAMSVQEDLERGGTCTDCGRGIRIVFSGDTRKQEGVSYEVFQTCGDEAPDYIDPKPRRVA